MADMSPAEMQAEIERLKKTMAEQAAEAQEIKATLDALECWPDPPEEFTSRIADLVRGREIFNRHDFVWHVGRGFGRYTERATPVPPVVRITMLSPPLTRTKDRVPSFS